MSQQPPPKKGESLPLSTRASVKVALIGAIATMVAAIVTAIFAPILVVKLVPPPTPTPSPTAYPPSGWNLVLSDPLKTNNDNWQEGTSSDGSASCRFMADGYQVSESKPNSVYTCFDTKSNFTNFAFEVQMTIVKGNQGGMIFRFDARTGNEYYFYISSRGTYELGISNPQSYQVLNSGANVAITPGLNQPNVIAVVAEGNLIKLYVNSQLIAAVSDSTSSAGQIGLIAGTSDKPPTEVIYKKAKVWAPSS